MEEFTHVSVLLHEAVDALNIRPEGVYVDGTLGRAGHSREIARRLTTGRLIAIDRDAAALEAAPERLGALMDKVTLVHGNFTDLSRLLDEAGVDKADGMLFDLGVSSPQLDDETRGFSYLKDAPLDMRMDASAPLTAQNVVNTWSQEELKRILRDYGEERYAAQIAAKIVRRREERPIETTLELAELIRRLERDGQLITLPDKLREVAALRRAHPEDTLAQLAQRCDPPITKSALNHRLRKLVELGKPD